ncbi:MAG: hypothetical protein LBJ72_00655 [Dysgonamonadaceae bacterium]|jgi:peroxiredoxin|nr:hypothetical protein [Dysgonamonadaceae bacterium]
MKISKDLIKKIDWFLISLSVAIIALSTFYFLFQVSQKQQESEHTESSVSDILVQNMSFLKPFELQSEGYELSPKLKIMEETGKEVVFLDLLGEYESVLIYRFSETHCDLCIEQHLSILKTLEGKISQGRLVLLCSYTNEKKMKIIRQTHNLNFKIYNIKDDVGIPLEQTSNPYFFILDRDMKCWSVFSAVKENPDLTISCIQAVIEKLI